MEKTIEQTFEELENLVGTMESGHSSLEESFACYEIGMKLVKECSKKIDQVEKKITILTEEGGDDHES
ncbi:MAG: exodeoxyribonuclease VII small subunit [Hungatella sp.]